MSGAPASAAEWTPRLDALVRALADRGDLRSRPWLDAFGTVPRHAFVPEIILTTDSGYHTLTAAERERWLDTAYSDDSLVTQHRPHAAGYRLPSGEHLHVPTSSSTMPGLMARMLEALDVHDGMRVLEIGTGTGYNAALLCARLGDHLVTSVDIDPALVDAARARLAHLGHHPALVAGDGTDGAPGHGPFDRIIATAAVPEIPPAWLHQLAPGGKILANVRGDLAGGTLALLTRTDDDPEASGPVLPIGGHFMWLRPDPADPHRPHERPLRQPGSPALGSTVLDPAALPVDDPAFRFLVQLDLPGIRGLWRGPAHDPATRTDRDAVIATASDGSRAEVFTVPEPDGSHRVVQAGPRRLWPAVESAHRLWLHLGRPQPGRYGVVATRTHGFVRLDDDTGWHRWPLPLT